MLLLPFFSFISFTSLVVQHAREKSGILALHRHDAYPLVFCYCCFVYLIYLMLIQRILLLFFYYM